MHELSLVHELLRRVEGLARERGATRVLTIRVGIGDLSGVDPELFRLGYATLVDFSEARGAELVVRPIPLEGRCRACEATFPIDRHRFICPDCGERDVVILRGEELLLESLTLESTDDAEQESGLVHGPTPGALVG